MQTFTTHEDMQWIELGGGTRRKIRSYNGEIMLVEVNFDDGAVGSDHSHPHAQISYVLSGEFTYHIEGEAHTMKVGDSIVTIVADGKITSIVQEISPDSLEGAN